MGEAGGLQCSAPHLPVPRKPLLVSEGGLCRPPGPGGPDPRRGRGLASQHCCMRPRGLLHGVVSDPGPTQGLNEGDPEGEVAGSQHRAEECVPDELPPLLGAPEWGEITQSTVPSAPAATREDHRAGSWRADVYFPPSGGQVSRVEAPVGPVPAAWLSAACPAGTAPQAGWTAPLLRDGICRMASERPTPNAAVLGPGLLESLGDPPQSAAPPTTVLSLKRFSRSSFAPSLQDPTHPAAGSRALEAVLI